MTYYNRAGTDNSNRFGSWKSKKILEKMMFTIEDILLLDSYGNRSRASNGNSLLDDLDSFDVGPIRPGPAVIKNFYSESPLITNRAQVKTMKLKYNRVSTNIVFC